MKKTKSAYKAPMVDAAAPPVRQGDCFGTFVREAQSIGNEVTARRAFDADVGEYLVEKKLTADFEAWREKKRATQVASTSP